MIKYRAFCSFDSIGAKIRKRWDTDQIFGGVFCYLAFHSFPPKHSFISSATKILCFIPYTI